MSEKNIELSDQKILQLYQDPSFYGSFSGVKNFQHFLFTDYGYHISSDRLYNLLKTLPNYIYNLRPKRKFPTRSYQIDSFGKLMGGYFQLL